MRFKIILIGVIMLFVCSVSFWLFIEKKTTVDLAHIVGYSNLDFAKEPVVFDGKYIFNREKFDRELSITRFNIYQFVMYYRRIQTYFPTIEKKLQEAGVPDDFKYLAAAESWLNDDISSGAGAAGVWQFMPDTARGYGLIVTDDVDERFHFEKSTDAAIKYLKKIHDDFSDWTLTAAAYNRGENGLRRALDDQKVKSYYDLYLNEETTRYVFRILAIKYVTLHAKEIFDAADLGESFDVPKTKELSVGKVDDLKTWAIDQGYNYATIRQLNPWIRGNKLPNGEWKVKVLEN